MATLGPSTSLMGQVSFIEHSDPGSDSDIDISDLINHSDKISSPVLASGGGAGSSEGQCPLGAEGGGDPHVSQNDINQQILTQLASLVDRLIQAKFTKKTVHSDKV